MSDSSLSPTPNNTGNNSRNRRSYFYDMSPEPTIISIQKSKSIHQTRINFHDNKTSSNQQRSRAKSVPAKKAKKQMKKIRNKKRKRKQQSFKQPKLITKYNTDIENNTDNEAIKLPPNITNIKVHEISDVLDDVESKRLQHATHSPYWIEERNKGVGVHPFETPKFGRKGSDSNNGRKSNSNSISMDNIVPNKATTMFFPQQNNDYELISLSFGTRMTYS